MNRELQIEYKTNRLNHQRRSCSLKTGKVCVATLTVLFVCISCGVFIYFEKITNQIEKLTRKMTALSKHINYHNRSVIISILKDDLESLPVKNAISNYAHKNDNSKNKRILFDNILVHQPTKSTPTSDVEAVHFVPLEFHEVLFKSRNVTGPCLRIWSGTFCVNQTFVNQAMNHVVRFFQTSKWMKEHMHAQPLQQSQSDVGQFITKKSGLYLLYLNVLIQATKSSHDIAIYINDDRKLDCRESLDYIRSPASNPYKYSKGKTCSISGVFYIEQNSRLSVRILTVQTVVILKAENTNFGAVLLKS